MMNAFAFRSKWSRGVPVVALGLAAAASAAAFRPTDDQQVLERLRTVPSDPGSREMRELRSRLTLQPEDVSLASQYARRCLDRARQEADPRFLGRAESALGPWWNSPQPPADVLVLRAIIRQSSHDFDAALTDLSRALQLQPGNAQAWLTQATVLTVLGRYDEARRACFRMTAVAPELVAVTAAASLASLTGEGSSSCRTLQFVLQRNGDASVAEKLWGLTVLAETTARLGRVAEAEGHYRAALGLGQRDPYLIGSYADFLLDLGRAGEVAALLQSETRADPLLLRLCLAESALNSTNPERVSHVQALQARFEGSRRRGDQVHQREEARFALHLQHQSGEALRLAQANWRVQREPADVRILLEAALAAGDPASAGPAVSFVQTSKLEDVQVERLMKQLTIGGTL